MSTLEMIVEELKTLPANKLDEAHTLIHNLREKSISERHAALDHAFGCLSEEEARQLEKAIKDNCERVDPREW
jgi:hypothetical protein